MTELDNIIDAFEKMSDLSYKRDEIRRLKNQNYETGTTCGHCIHWMISSQCPRESKRHKVSCGEFKCDKFIMQTHYIGLIERNNDKIKQLESEIKSL